jgi:ubiquitin-protein ligase
MFLHIRNNFLHCFRLRREVQTGVMPAMHRETLTLTLGLWGVLWLAALLARPRMPQPQHAGPLAAAPTGSSVRWPPDLFGLLGLLSMANSLVRLLQWLQLRLWPLRSLQPPARQRQAAEEPGPSLRYRLRRELLHHRADFAALGVALPPRLEHEYLPTGAGGVTSLALAVPGAPGTPLQGTLWQVQLDIPANYPFAPPRARFPRGIVHPNVSAHTHEWMLRGGSAWSPAIRVFNFVLEMQAVLAAPVLEGSAVANADAARQVQQDAPAFFEQLVALNESQRVRL